MQLQSVAEQILDGNAVLFTGAGFSQGALNVKGEQVSTGKAFSDHLCSLVGVPPVPALDEAAELYLDVHGPDQLLQLLRLQFKAKTISGWHRQILRAPWRRLYTTNYDNIAELAAASVGKQTTSAILDDQLRSLPKDGLLCVHLNGYIDRITLDSVYGQLKLTETSYASGSLETSPWSVCFREDMQTSQIVVFVGYSLYDLDIKRILAATSETKAKCHFIVGTSPDEAVLRRVAKYGEVHRISTEDFGSILEESAKTYVPAQRILPVLRTSDEVTVPDDEPILNDADFIDLFTQGHYTFAKICASQRSDEKYYLHRDKIESTIETLMKGKSVVARSSLGNGKSLFLEGLKYEALRKGYRVFSPRIHTSDSLSDFEAIASLTGEKRLIVIDSYQSWITEIRRAADLGDTKLQFVLTARSSVHDVVLDDLLDALGGDVIEELDLDKLNESDISWIAEAMASYGLWGSHAAKGVSTQRKILREDCHGEFHAILLRLFSSTDIGTRFDELLKGIVDNRHATRMLYTILILNLIGLTPTINDLMDLWDARTIATPAFRRHPVVLEMMELQSGRVKVRSSVAAEFIIRVTDDVGGVVDTLIALAKRAQVASSVSYRYRSLFNELIRFRNIQRVLPEKDGIASVIRFYEAMKNERDCRENPLFWLQYAVACFVKGELTRADRYFDTAYAFAERNPSFDTFQIDNHYARFLLMNAIENQSCPDAFEAFRRARSIISRQVQSERRYYPYRVAISYGDFFERFRSQLSREQLDEMLEASILVLDRIHELPYELRGNRYVVACRARLESLAAACEKLAKVREMEIAEGVSRPVKGATEN